MSYEDDMDSKKIDSEALRQQAEKTVHAARVETIRNGTLDDAANAVFEALGGYPGPEIVTFGQALEAVRDQRADLDRARTQRDEAMRELERVRESRERVYAERDQARVELYRVTQDAEANEHYRAKEYRRVMDSLLPITREHRFTRMDTLGNRLAVGHVAEAAAALLRWYAAENERLNGALRSTQQGLIRMEQQRDARPANELVHQARAVEEVRIEKLPHGFECGTATPDGLCRYFVDGSHRCCVAPLGNPAHGTTDHQHDCMCGFKWTTERNTQP